MIGGSNLGAGALIIQTNDFEMFHMLRSTHTLNHLRYCRQTSKLDYLVTVQCMAIKTHGQRYTTQHASMMGYRPIVKMSIFRGRPLHHTDTSSTSDQFMEIRYLLIGLSIADTTVM
jgi:hypothetical protein